MEDDRAVADLGPDISADPAHDDASSDKKPKRRFIGRRAADAKAAARVEQNGGNGGIEDSGAIQGEVYNILSKTARTTNSCVQRQSRHVVDLREH